MVTLQRLLNTTWFMPGTEPFVSAPEKGSAYPLPEESVSYLQKTCHPISLTRRVMDRIFHPF